MTWTRRSIESLYSHSHASHHAHAPHPTFAQSQPLSSALHAGTIQEKWVVQGTRERLGLRKSWVGSVCVMGGVRVGVGVGMGVQ
jgi:hypothetical protein